MDFATRRTRCQQQPGHDPETASRTTTAPATTDVPEPFAVELNRGDGRPDHRHGNRQRMVVKVVVLVHLSLALGLVLYGPGQGVAVPLMAAVAVPFAQASLIVLWAGTRQMRSVLRFVVAAIGAAWAWFVAIAVLPDIALRSAESAGWAAGLAVQAAVILAAASVWRVWRRVPDAEGGREPGRRRMQYDLASLLGWTAVVAMLLGLGQAASGLLGWDGEAARWTFYRFLPIVGVFNAVFALCVVFALAGQRGRAVRVAAGGLAVFALAWLEPRLVEWMAGTAGGLDVNSSLTLAATQAALVLATLVPIRICGQ